MPPRVTGKGKAGKAKPNVVHDDPANDGDEDNDGAPEMSARELHAQQEALMKHAANKGQGTSNVDTMTSANAAPKKKSRVPVRP